jgi:hypothetical protein
LLRLATSTRHVTERNLREINKLISKKPSGTALQISTFYIFAIGWGKGDCPTLWRALL